MNLHSKPFGWYAHHVHASDLHLIVTLSVLFRQAKDAGAMIGDALSDRFAAALTSAARAAGLPADRIVPLVYEATPESVRVQSLAALDRALSCGCAGLWLVLSPPLVPSENGGLDGVDLAWTHLTEHYPISVLCVLPFEEYGGRSAGSLRGRHAYYYSAGRLVR